MNQPPVHSDGSWSEQLAAPLDRRIESDRCEGVRRWMDAYVYGPILFPAGAYNDTTASPLQLQEMDKFNYTRAASCGLQRKHVS